MPQLPRYFLVVSCIAAAAALGFGVAGERHALIAVGLLVISALVLLMVRERRRPARADDDVRLSPALAHATVGMLLVEAAPGHPVADANAAFLRWTGLDAAAVVGRSIDAVYGPAATALLDDHETRREVALLRADGLSTRVEVAANPIRGGDGAVEAWVLVQIESGHGRQATDEALAENERRLRLITDSIPVLTGQLDRGLRFRFVNRRFEDWFGKPNWWFVGRHVREVVGEEAFRRARRAFTQALRGVAAAQDIHIVANGQLREVRVEIVPELADGEVVGFFVLAQDVSDGKRAEADLRRAHDEMQAAVELRTRELRREILERRQMEAALRESERRFRDVAEAASDWFWEMGPDLRFTYCSDRVADFTGLSPEHFIGNTRRDMAMPEDLPALEPHFAHLDERRPFRDLRYRLRKPQGGFRHVKVSGKPVFDEDGRFLGFRGTGCDITDQVEMEARTAALQRQLVVAVEGMSDGFALWDTSDRLIICNDVLRTFFPAAASALQPGLRFSDFVAMVSPSGMRPEPLRHAPGEVVEWQQSDGRWLMIAERGLPDGQLVGTFTDISERKSREAALKQSEERFRLLVQTAGSAILVLARDLRILEFNRAAEGIYGLRREDVIGRSYLDLCPTEAVRAGVVEQTGRVLAGHAATELETRIHHRDGRYCDVIWNAHRLVDGNGAVLGVISVGQDISERKAAERAMRESRSALRALHEITASQELDFSGKLRALLRFGCGAFDLPLGLLVRLGRRIEVAEAVRLGEALAVGAGLLEDCRHLFAADQVAYVRPPGSQRADDPAAPWLEALLGARVNIGDEPYGTLCFLSNRARGEFDDTEREIVKLMAQWLGGEMGRIQAVNELRAAMEQAELANRTKSEFLANMSHELRTPLNAVIGFSEVMMAEVFGPVGNAHYAGYVRNINDSGRHLLDVINDILDVSKIEAGRLELIEENVHVPRLVESAIRLVRERATEAGLTLEVRLAEHVPALRGDQRRLKQILLNLLSNAIKFTPAGGRVTLRADCDDDGLVLAVRDTGIGMAADDIPKAMAAFGQIDSRLARRHEGTGLGLPLTRSLVELHGGRLDITSELGVGTTVRAIFPPGRLFAAEPADSVGA